MSALAWPDLPRELPADLTALLDLTSSCPGADLDTVLSGAELQTRVDRRYLLDPEQLSALEALPASFHALEIGRRRVFGYESIYFDTPDRRLYRDHVQGRRRRYKARTRTYLDSAETMFEVKLKGGRSETVKHRMGYDLASRAHLTPEAGRFLRDLVQREYGVRVPGLGPSLTTTYSRSTLVDLDRADRLTCDAGLTFSHDGDRVRAEDLVVVESKSTLAGRAADEVLRGLGARPVSMSKYCVGLAMLDPGLPANRWHRVLVRHFGADRSAPATAA